jgi:UDP-hydrolysing UDP-N-acetyl-D-glucosamine 2-epimerase
MRHAITKLAHLHFVATKQSRERVISMGERRDRVFTVGAPGLDSIIGMEPLGSAELERRVGFPLRSPLVLLVQHSVSTRPHSGAEEIRESLEALHELGYQTMCVYPNSDAGGQKMIKVIESYRGEPWLHISPSLEHDTYLSLLSAADVLVGNTSSGIIEAPSFQLPVVNIGERQAGRERGDNVIDSPPDRNAIRDALEQAVHSENFRAQVLASVNPYGDGHASERIVDVLRSLRITQDLLQKQFAD